MFKNFKKAYIHGKYDKNSNHKKFHSKIFFSFPKKLWNQYTKALRTRPILTNSLTSCVVAGIGDALAQKLVHNQHQEELVQEAYDLHATHYEANNDTSAVNSTSIDSYEASGTGSIIPPESVFAAEPFEVDFVRMFRMSFWGILSGGPIYYWFKFLDNSPVKAYNNIILSGKKTNLDLIVNNAIKNISNANQHFTNAIQSSQPGSQLRNKSTRIFSPTKTLFTDTSSIQRVHRSIDIFNKIHLQKYLQKPHSMISKFSTSMTSSLSTNIGKHRTTITNQFISKYGAILQNIQKLRSTAQLKTGILSKATVTPYISHGIILTGRQRFFQNLYKVLVHQAVFAPLQNMFFFGWIFTSAMLEDHIRSLDYNDLTIDIRALTSDWKLSLLRSLRLERYLSTESRIKEGDANTTLIDESKGNTFPEPSLPTKIVQYLHNVPLKLQSIDWDIVLNKITSHGLSHVSHLSYLSHAPDYIYTPVDPNYITDVRLCKTKLKTQVNNQESNRIKTVESPTQHSADISTLTKEDSLSVPLSASAPASSAINTPLLPSFKEVATVISEITGSNVEMLMEKEKKYFDKHELFKQWGDKLLNDVAPVTLLALFVMGPVQLLNQYRKPEFRALIQAFAFIGWSSYLSIVGHKTKTVDINQNDDDDAD